MIAEDLAASMTSPSVSAEVCCRYADRHCRPFPEPSSVIILAASGLLLYATLRRVETRLAEDKQYDSIARRRLSWKGLRVR